ncbi:tetratricopeptide repeat protein [Flavobacterium reichenbachii]|uniref:Uncharacterized protein n=1 Tax=Flavobacterium reichenbachii TaxID=362418 RepID=A0A085ZI06_9FLAO|nr:tetratricopeptide repeat protein [Flavobacterium reichenbachii]KFF04070.1 hypothetical protein IW19_00330 [Flavobacterium reichenbachii]OXB12878.1 hypothetical protein B0A68_17080 [Flavobacterium reichenbachii]
MINYKPYKEFERVYFNLQEFLFFPILVTFIPSLISYGLLFLGGIPLVLAFNLVISFIGFFYFHFYGKSSQRISVEFIIGWLLVFSYFTIVDYGFYLIYEYQITNHFNNLHFYIWAFIVFGLPLLYFVFQDIRYLYLRWNMASNFIKTRIKIIHDPEFHLYIDKIEFINTQTKRISNTKIERNFQWTISQIPMRTNLLVLTWYSFNEEKYYQSKIEFPYHKLVLTPVKYPLNEPAVLRGRETESLKIYLSLNGSVDLFTTEKHLFFSPESKSISITEAEKEIKTNNYISISNFENKGHFQSLIKKIRESHVIERNAALLNKQFIWSFSFESLLEETKIEILDTLPTNDEIVSDINLPIFRHLPKTITLIYWRYHWAVIDIDSNKLHDFIENTAGENEDILIHFSILLKNTDGDLDFKIRIDDREINFEDWIIKIDSDRKESVDNRIKRLQEQEYKNSLYQKTWPLITAKKYDEAQKICDELILNYPDFGFGYFVEARLLWYTQGSEACYKKLDYFIENTKHDPYALAIIYNNFGCLLDLESRYEEALDYFVKATRANPEEGIFLCNIAEIYCKLKQSDKAVLFAEKAREKGHNSEILNEILETEGTKVF